MNFGLGFLALPHVLSGKKIAIYLENFASEILELDLLNFFVGKEFQFRYGTIFSFLYTVYCTHYQNYIRLSNTTKETLHESINFV